MQGSELACARLRAAYSKVANPKTPLGTEDLNRIYYAAMGVFDSETGRPRVIAYLLACIVREFSEAFENQPVSYPEFEECRSVAHQSISNAIDWLDSGAPQSGFQKVAIDLADARAKMAGILAPQNSN